MNYSQGLQIFCIFLIFFLSLVGFYFPIYIHALSFTSSNAVASTTTASPTASSTSSIFKFFSYQTIYLLLKCCGSGIILGVALVHLLADAVGELSEYGEYPYALVLAGAGSIFTLGIDQVAHYFMIHIVDNTCGQPLQQQNEGVARKSLEIGDVEDGGVINSNNDRYLAGKCEYKCDHQHPHEIIDVLTNSNTTHITTIKAWIMEGAVAVHSVIIGFGFGILTQQDAGTIRILTVAFSIHQFFEGISLGTAVHESSFDKMTTAKFAATFALTFPAGAILGMIVKSIESNTESDSAVLTQSIANALAAGILLHTVFCEMIPDDFSSSHHSHSSSASSHQQLNSQPHKPKGALKFAMYLSLSLGFSLMAILALWA